MPKKKDVYTEAVEDAERLKSAVMSNAKGILADSMAPAINKAVNEALHEGLGGSGEPPSDYDEAGEQERMGDEVEAKGDTPNEDLADMGDGAAVVESGIEEDGDVTEGMFGEDDEFGDEEGIDDLDDSDDDVFGGEEDLELDDEGGDEELESLTFEDDDIDIEGDDDDVIDIVDDEGDEEMDYESTVNTLKKENAGLRKQNAKLEKAVYVMKDTIQEVNLFNARLAGASRIMKNAALTQADKDKILETFDGCETVGEVKRTYKALKEAYKGTRPARKHKVNRRPVQPTASSRIDESAKPGNIGGSRMQTLAGIL